MDVTHPPAARVRWLVAGTFSSSPSGRRFLLTEASFADQLGRAARGLYVTVQDRIGSGDVNSYEVSFDRLTAFQLSEVIHGVPALRALRTAHDALSSARTLGPQEAAQLKSSLGQGRLFAAMAQALHDARSPQEARGAALTVLDDLLFLSANDLLQHSLVKRLESAWRGLHWLWEHCPTARGLDIEVLDVAPEQLAEALAECLGAPPLQRPDACFLLDTLDDVDILHRLAALGEQAWVPMVVTVQREPEETRPSDAWTRLRADEVSRWLCAAVNPVVMMAEHHGAVRRECFTSPSLAVAALLAASFRETRTFARLTGPGGGTRAPAVWQPKAGSTVATEVGLSLREQERLAARGLAAVSGWWDSNAVLLSAAPTVYGGRDAVPLPAQLLTGRIVRITEALVERLPADASNEAISALFARAGEAILSAGPGRTCQLQGRVVSTGHGERGVAVLASAWPELAGTPLQLEFTLPLRA